MRKPWSISTTVRNPERLRNFLRVLEELENENFDRDNQIKYQILLIQNKFYKPTNVPQKMKQHYDSLNPMPYEDAETIFYEQRYVDPAMRGRQSANPLNKLGFSIARESLGSVVITPLGKKFLSGDYDVSTVFFKSLLKFQFPNPWSDDFSRERGFNITPLIATFHLISELNKKSPKQGLNKDEFSIFIPTLINVNQIDEYVERILEYREEKNKDNYIRNFAYEFYQTTQVSAQMINNFFEYGDNTMRYFRLTKYFRVETDPLGYYWTINLESSRQVEINQLLSIYNGEIIKKYESFKEYLNYISDFSQPELPWEKIENIRKVTLSVKDTILELLKKPGLPITQEQLEIVNSDISLLSVNELEKYISKLRNINLELKEKIRKKQLVGNKTKTKQIIDLLRDRKQIRRVRPEQFEKLITDAFKIVNDEIKIKPNFPVDDEGEPIMHAPGGKPDIECFYQTFKAICEVTLNTSGKQWVQEGQPVMRHLREFEMQNSDDEGKIFCVFLAPLIHNDTYNTFWISVKYEYDGTPQKIIPMTTEQFTIVLETLLTRLNRGQSFSHRELYALFSQIIANSQDLNSFSDWANAVQNNLIKWSTRLVSV